MKQYICVAMRGRPDAMPYSFDDVKVSSYFSEIGAFESALDRVYEKMS